MIGQYYSNNKNTTKKNWKNPNAENPGEKHWYVFYLRYNNLD